MNARSNPAADTILSGAAILGISASLLVIAATSSPAVMLAACALISLSIAGVAGALDQQTVQIAKNPASLFTQDSVIPKQQAEVDQHASSLTT